VRITATHTYAELELSPIAYEEIKTKLKAAGYEHAFMEGGAIDMHGIGVTRAEGPLQRCTRCGWLVDTTCEPEFPK
jgi:hypothetical protein